MDTIIKNSNEKDTVSLAAEIIKKGGLVAIPTETVYGLAADALSPNAVTQIFKAKGRPSDNPLIVHISDISQADRLAKKLPDSFFKLADRFWPGPLTMIVEKSDLVPKTTSGGLDTVAIRMPDSLITREIISASGCPLAAPSANISGSPSPTTARHVKNDMQGKIDMIVDGGECAVGVESTVITLVGDIPMILRPGGITKEQLELVIGRVDIHPAVVGELKSDEQATSPGMKYKHYAPKTQVVILDCDKKDYIKFILLNKDNNIGALCFDGDEKYIPVPHVCYGSEEDDLSQAAELFAALRECDGMNVDIVYARMPHRDGVGLAVYNRLIRAAAHKIVKPSLPFIVGLTGGSGAGKTTVSQAFAQNGFFAVDADGAAREVVRPGSSTLKALAEAFSDGIINPDGSLNRKALADRAFADKKSTEILNSITHPAIVSLIFDKIRESGAKFVLIDAPQLFESGLNEVCDLTVGVTADRAVRLTRIMRRDGIDRAAAEKRIDAANSDEFFIKNCDKILVNNGQQSEALTQAENIARDALKGR